MKTDEIDDIIAQAVAESKGKSKWHRPKKSNDTIKKARSVLNILFMLGFLAAVIIYFVFPDNKALFFCVGFGAMLLKIVEFALRFLF